VDVGGEGGHAGGELRGVGRLLAVRGAVHGHPAVVHIDVLEAYLRGDGSAGRHCGPNKAAGRTCILHACLDEGVRRVPDVLQPAAAGLRGSAQP
jgi:hypothetical protein